MSAQWPVLTDRPDPRRWDFGGHPYAVEPLTMPEAGVWIGSPRGLPDVPGRSLIDRYRVPPEQTTVAEPADELYWFRWITGHQVSFLLWRLIGQLTNKVDDGRIPPGEAAAPLRTYIRGYCGMLLYTGSCPRRTYDRVIRPSMQLQHPAFSGGWAPDFWPVRDLLRGRRTVFTGRADAADLQEAVVAQRVVHEVVAARLVPDGVSLLRGSGVQTCDLSVLRLLFDNYFLTLRAPVGTEAVTAQLFRRLVAIARDLEVNGLHPGSSQPGPIRYATVAEYEADLPVILDDVANAAVHAPAAVVDA